MQAALSATRAERSGTMTYPGHEKDWYSVLYRTASSPAKWRKGMFYWNGGKPTFAACGRTITDVIEWKYNED